MKWYIILGHELVELDLVWILPPFFPVWCITTSNTGITYGSIKPNVHNFMFKALFRNRCTPLKISGNTSILQSLFNPCLGGRDGILSPFSFWVGLFEPFFECRLEFREIQETMLGILNDWVRLTSYTFAF